MISLAALRSCSGTGKSGSREPRREEPRREEPRREATVKVQPEVGEAETGETVTGGEDHPFAQTDSLSVFTCQASVLNKQQLNTPFGGQ